MLFSVGDFDYLVITPEHENQFISVIAESFSSRHKLAIYMGFPKEFFESIIRSDLDSCMGRELSVACVHRPTQEVCGGLTVSKFDSDAIENSDEHVLRMLTAMDCQFFNRHSNIDRKLCMHQDLLGVSHKWAGNKIGENQILASLQVGKDKGLTYAVIELSAPGSQHICLDLLRYVLDQEIIFSDYICDGVQPFQYLEGTCVLAFKEIN